MNKQENKEKIQKDFYEIVGVKDDEIYMLDYLFKHSDGFRGATGTIFRAVSREEYEERMNDTEYFKEFWIEAVKDGRTEYSFEDWLKYNDLPNEDAVFDLSYYKYHDKIRKLLNLSEEEYPIIECIGGGRVFTKNMKFDKVFRKDLIKEINKYED